MRLCEERRLGATPGCIIVDRTKRVVGRVLRIIATLVACLLLSVLVAWGLRDLLSRPSRAHDHWPHREWLGFVGAASVRRAGGSPGDTQKGPGDLRSRARARAMGPRPSPRGPRASRLVEYRDGAGAVRRRARDHLRQPHQRDAVRGPSRDRCRLADAMPLVRVPSRLHRRASSRGASPRLVSSEPALSDRTIRWAWFVCSPSGRSS